MCESKRSKIYFAKCAHARTERETEAEKRRETVCWLEIFGVWLWLLVFFFFFFSLSLFWFGLVWSRLMEPLLWTCDGSDESIAHKRNVLFIFVKP